ncbi:hypothetical protein N7457_005772 [Penicillium paradoxum]|uniref:uncharacterized protein n=1 Tax=Penicillium paradoxum TaxID=176176 RepID=UPI00254748F5|nr:uncharacterized protein N7457_005772 [Penicillium paradoxum]KAJ5780612.1 hypothetical protein N7457_005772 [Penicillium paradoxum]
MCSNKHPLARARRTQVIFSVLSWPCALAALLRTYGSAQGWMQLIAISISTLTPIFILVRYRKSGSQFYPLLVIAIDALMALLFIGVFISGMFILSTQDISLWVNPDNFKLASGIPQIYSNLSCLILSLVYLRTFVQASFNRYMQLTLKTRQVNYTLCPACDRSVDAPVGQRQDMAMAAEQQRASGSVDSLCGLYTGDAESQQLLPESV